MKSLSPQAQKILDDLLRYRFGGVQSNELRPMTRASFRRAIHELRNAGHRIKRESFGAYVLVR